jgi:hypothetical protein
MSSFLFSVALNVADNVQQSFGHTLHCCCYFSSIFSQFFNPNMTFAAAIATAVRSATSARLSAGDAVKQG